MFPQELAQFNFVAPGGISPIIVECVKEAGFTLVEVKSLSPFSVELFLLLHVCTYFEAFQ